MSSYHIVSVVVHSAMHFKKSWIFVWTKKVAQEMIMDGVLECVAVGRLFWAAWPWAQWAWLPWAPRPWRELPWLRAEQQWSVQDRA